MTNEPNTFDVNFVFDLVQRPTLEEELHMEKEIRAIRESDDIEQVKQYAEDTARQNHHQSIFIAGCLNRIAELQTMVVKQQTAIAQKKPTLLQRILKLQ